MTVARYRSITGEVIDALQTGRDTPRHVIDALVGYPDRLVPRYRVGDWLVRHDDGCITAMTDPDFWTLYQPTEE